MRIEISRARVNIKSLAAEAKIIRQEVSKAKSTHIKNDLHHHKIEVVRPEARLAQLALAFLKNMPYKAVEITNKPLDISRLGRKINLFLMGYAPVDQKYWKISREQIISWINA